jgi:molybdate transport system regulatory protein
MFKIRGRIWVESEGGTFVGYGRITLLERIKKYGSISEAARSMGMSYRHAWEMIDSMNKKSGSPLVETASGGVGGGGTTLTAYGENVLDEFKKLYRKFKEFNESQSFDI